VSKSTLLHFRLHNSLIRRPSWTLHWTMGMIHVTSSWTFLFDCHFSTALKNSSTSEESRKNSGSFCFGVAMGIASQGLTIPMLRPARLPFGSSPQKWKKTERCLTYLCGDDPKGRRGGLSIGMVNPYVCLSDR